MFLDEKLLEIGRSIDLSSDESVNAKVLEMFTICRADTFEKTVGYRDDDTIRACFDRTNWIWNKVRETLAAEGIEALRLDGFKKVLEDHGHGLLFTQKLEK